MNNDPCIRQSAQALSNNLNEMDNLYSEYEKLIHPFKTGEKSLTCDLDLDTIDFKTLIETYSYFIALLTDIPELQPLKYRYGILKIRIRNILKTISRNLLMSDQPNVYVYSDRVGELVNVTWMLDIIPIGVLAAQNILDQFGDVDLTWIDDDLTRIDDDHTLMQDTPPESAYATATLSDQEEDVDLSWIDEDN